MIQSSSQSSLQEKKKGRESLEIFFLYLFFLLFPLRHNLVACLRLAVNFELPAGASLVPETKTCPTLNISLSNQVLSICNL